jgi:hypothetical protein
MPSAELLEKIKKIAESTKNTGGRTAPIFTRAQKHQFVKKRQPHKKKKEKINRRIC